MHLWSCTHARTVMCTCTYGRVHMHVCVCTCAPPSLPIGSCMTIGLAPNRSTIVLTQK